MAVRDVKRGARLRIRTHEGARDPKGRCVTDGSPCHRRSIGSERTEKCMNADHSHVARGTAIVGEYWLKRGVAFRTTACGFYGPRPAAPPSRETPLITAPTRATNSRDRSPDRVHR